MAEFVGVFFTLLGHFSNVNILLLSLIFLKDGPATELLGEKCKGICFLLHFAAYYEVTLVASCCPTFSGMFDHQGWILRENSFLPKKCSYYK